MNPGAEGDDTYLHLSAQDQILQRRRYEELQRESQHEKAWQGEGAREQDEKAHAASERFVEDERQRSLEQQQAALRFEEREQQRLLQQQQLQLMQQMREQELLLQQKHIWEQQQQEKLLQEQRQAEERFQLQQLQLMQRQEEELRLQRVSLQQLHEQQQLQQRQGQQPHLFSSGSEVKAPEENPGVGTLAEEGVPGEAGEAAEGGAPGEVREEGVRESYRDVNLEVLAAKKKKIKTAQRQIAVFL